jgi:Spy/CpxP family protein refolding chaperone
MKKPIICVWIGLLAICMVEGVFAQGALKDFPPTKWWTNKQVIKRLNLSEDQQSKIEAIWIKHRRTLIDEKAQVDKLALDFEELVGKDLIDETAALKAFDKLHEARTSLERTTFLMRIQILNQLSAEQLRQLEPIAEVLRQQRAKVSAAPAPSPAAPAKKKQGH